ncbi:MAG: DUF2461 family protein [Polyangiaceae bacterium]
MTFAPQYSVTPNAIACKLADGAGRTSALARDVRFSKDKSPYKAHIGGFLPLARKGLIGRPGLVEWVAGACKTAAPFAERLAFATA